MNRNVGQASTLRSTTTEDGSCLPPSASISLALNTRAGRSAAFRPLQCLRCPAAQEFCRAAGIVQRGSGVNAALLSLAQRQR